MVEYGNGLILNYVNTEYSLDSVDVKEFKQLSSVVAGRFEDSGLVVAYLDYKVLIGKFDNSQLIFYENETFKPKFLQKMRIFNRYKELLLWKQDSGREFRLRVRQDSGNGVHCAVDANQVLWGTFSEDLGHGWSLLREDRGTELIVPLDNLNVNNKKHRLAVKTRNYVRFNNTGQATYYDCRFVELINIGR